MMNLALGSIWLHPMINLLWNLLNWFPTLQYLPLFKRIKLMLWAVALHQSGFPLGNQSNFLIHFLIPLTSTILNLVVQNPRVLVWKVLPGSQAKWSSQKQMKWPWLYGKVERNYYLPLFCQVCGLPNWRL